MLAAGESYLHILSIKNNTLTTWSKNILNKELLGLTGLPREVNTSRTPGTGGGQD